MIWADMPVAVCVDVLDGNHVVEGFERVEKGGRGCQAIKRQVELNCSRICKSLMVGVTL
jgi:hypothetical protein